MGGGNDGHSENLCSLGAGTEDWRAEELDCSPAAGQRNSGPAETCLRPVALGFRAREDLRALAPSRLADGFLMEAVRNSEQRTLAEWNCHCCHLGVRSLLPAGRDAPSSSPRTSGPAAICYLGLSRMMEMENALAPCADRSAAGRVVMRRGSPGWRLKMIGRRTSVQESSDPPARLK